MIVHTARILGPAAAGVVIALLGVGPCFLVNALSFGAMLRRAARDGPRALHTPEVARPRPRPAALGAALRRAHAGPADPAGHDGRGRHAQSFNFQVLLPLLASFTWHGTAATYTALAVAMGDRLGRRRAGRGARGRVGPRLLVGAAAAFGVAELLVAVAPTLELQLLALSRSAPSA